VGVLGSPQDQILSGKYVDEAGITFHHFYSEVQNTIERLMKTVSRGDTADGVVQNVYMRVVNRN
jgi:hypothetical protein